MPKLTSKKRLKTRLKKGFAISWRCLVSHQTILWTFRGMSFMETRKLFSLSFIGFCQEFLTFKGKLIPPNSWFLLRCHPNFLVMKKWDRPTKSIKIFRLSLLLLTKTLKLSERTAWIQTNSRKKSHSWRQRKNNSWLKSTYSRQRVTVQIFNFFLMQHPDLEKNRKMRPNLEKKRENLPICLNFMKEIYFKLSKVSTTFRNNNLRI